MRISGYFDNIRNSCGVRAVNIMKQILKISRKIASYNNRKIFLLQCRAKQVFPNHIINNIKCIFSIEVDEHRFKNEAAKILYKFRKSILNLEIKITIDKVKQLNYDMEKLYDQLRYHFDDQGLEEFREYVYVRYSDIFLKIKKENIKKITNLEAKYGRKDLMYGDKFLYNYTGVELPIEAKRILSAGPKMSIPPSKKEIPIPNIIKDLEYNLSQGNITEDNKTLMRNRAINIITNFCNRVNNYNKQNNIQRDYNITKNFLKNNKELYVLNSDKGNSTVIMTKSEYITAMSELLNDNNMYKILDRDPTTKFHNKARMLIDKLLEQKIITKEHHSRMKRINPVAPKLYGMRKTHKPNLSMRPVVSCINSPSYNIASFVHTTLTPYTNTFDFNIKNSQEFVQSIRNIQLPDDYVLISLDVVSLFTNIPKNLFFNIIKDEWHLISEYVNMDRGILLELTSFLFDSSYFKFNNNLYQQLDGSAMGNPASPIIANIVMNFVINNVLKELNFPVPIFKLYVDDSFLAVPKDKIEFVVSCFNSFHSKIQFTVEVEENGYLPFLDTVVHREDNGTLTTDWFVKPSSSGRILNFLSNSPIQHKRNIVLNMINKIHSICSMQHIDKNIHRVKQMLKTNNYPSFFVNQIIQQYTCNNNSMSVTRPNNVTLQGSTFKYMKFPFISHLSYKLGKLFSAIPDMRVVFYNTKTVRNLFTRIKDRDDIGSLSNVVYKIKCNGCDTCYVGQTKQLLKNRLKQHRYDCLDKNKNKKEKTALAKHHFDNDGHVFDFEKVSIVDRETNWLKRNMSEMIHIQLNSNNINYRTDTQHLNPMYKSLLQKYNDMMNS